MDAVTKKEVSLNRKMMAEMIKNEPETFARVFTEITGEKVEALKGVEVTETVTEAPKKEAKKDASKKEEKKEEVKSEGNDDLTKVEGIGPKIAETLTEAGVSTFAELSKKSSEEIQEIITDVRGSHDSETWPKQAEMAVEGKWDELKAWQDELDGGSKA